MKRNNEHLIIRTNPALLSYGTIMLQDKRRRMLGGHPIFFAFHGSIDYTNSNKS